MAQLNACQFRHRLKFGHQDIFDLLNRFLRYHQLVMDFLPQLKNRELREQR